MPNGLNKKWIAFSLIVIAASLFAFVVIFEEKSPQYVDEPARVGQSDSEGSMGGNILHSSEVDFADAALEEAIRKALGKEIGEVTRNDLLSLTELDAEEQFIIHLDGIEHLTHLKHLNLKDNFITDLRPLMALNQLETLNIRGNRITDISPLAHLTSLVDLNIRGNDIEDIAALSGLTQLQRLVARDNAIVDISPLASLHSLFDLNIRGNNIVDVSPLLALPNLYDRLYLDGNPIENMALLVPIAWQIKEIDFDLSSELATIEFSKDGGFYTEPFTLTLSSSDPNGRIYYTLDGSEPSTDSIEYNNPIQISDNRGKPNHLSMIRTTVDHLEAFWREPEGEVFKGTVVRAVAYDENGIAGPVVTQTYWVDEGINGKYTFPIISIATHEDLLFDHSVGLYVNGNWEERGRQAEIPIHIALYEPDGELGFALNAGLRIQGGWNRRVAHKSLRIYARSEYDRQNAIMYDVFPGLKKGKSDEPLQRFDRLILRNSGNDHNSTLFRDAMIQRLVGHMNVDTQAYRPAIVFINGEYWGIHNMRERYDDWHLHNHYGVSRDDITIIENGELGDGDQIGLDHYEALLQYVRTYSMEHEQHYQHVVGQVDIDNLIDYNIAQIFIGNTDWPHNNMRLWKYNGTPSDRDFGHDGKWRWMLYDTDFGFGIYRENVPSHDTLSHAVGESDDKVLFTYLLNHDDFKNRFINRFADMLNSTFAVERMIAMIDEMAAVVEEEIDEHVARWGTIGSKHHWQSQVDAMKSYARARPEYQIKHIEDFFSLSGTYELVLEQRLEQGSVRVNSLDITPQTPGISNAGQWRGTYFNGVPLELTAVPQEGYRFKRWEGLDGLVDEATRPTVFIVPNKNITVVPVYEKI